MITIVKTMLQMITIINYIVNHYQILLLAVKDHRKQNEIFIEMFDCEVELDENYFVGVSQGSRGHGATGETTVFGIFY